MRRVLALAALAVATAAHAQLSCNGRFELSYPGISPFTKVGDVVTLRSSFGAGPILGGSTLFVNNFAVELACDASFPIIPCVAEPGKVKYLGDAQTTTTCTTCVNISTHLPVPCAFTSNSPAGGSVPNDVIFQLPPDVFLLVPELSAVPFCSVDVKVEKLAESSDATPNLIEENAGYLASAVPNCPNCLAVCDNFILTSQVTQSSALVAAPANGAFQCYEAPRHSTSKPNVGVTVTDQFGSDAVTALRIHDFCAPTDLNGQDPLAPLNPVHEAGYVLGGVDSAKFATPTVAVTTALGTFTMRVGTPQLLFVPTAKSVLPGPPPAPLVVPTNHYLCHAVSNVSPSGKGIRVSEHDQFVAFTQKTAGVKFLCAPAQKNAEPIIDPTAFLLCFGPNTPKSTPGLPLGATVAIDNQFGTATIDVTQVLSLCVAATL